MSNFEFLKVFIDVKDSKLEKKHRFLSVSPEKLNTAITKLKGDIPKELLEFYQQIGYGFFHRLNKNSFDRLMSPLQFADINLREDIYEFDPDLEIYNEKFYEDKSIFFEVNEGVYLLVNKEDKKGKNAIYYFDKKIADPDERRK